MSRFAESDDTHPWDDITAPDIEAANELAYRDEVAQRLMQAAGEYLEFSTFREMMRLLVDC